MELLDSPAVRGVKVRSATCRLSFDDGQAYDQCDRKMESLLEPVAEHLD